MNRFNKYKNLRSYGEIQEPVLGLHFKGGGSSSTTTKPSPEQEAILRKQLAMANSLERKGNLQYYGGDTVANTNQFTTLGQNQQLGGASQLGQLNPSVLNAAYRGLNSDLVNDPRTEALAQATTRPMQEQFLEQTLPNISSAASSQGAFGGDRANILRAQAGRDFTRNIGDVRANIFNDANRAGMAQQLGVLQSLPQVSQGVLAPGQATQAVGNQREDYNQQNIDADRERFEFGQYADTDTANRVNSILSGVNFGQTTTSKSGGK